MPVFVFEKIVVVVALDVEDPYKVQKCLVENYHLVDICHSNSFLLIFFMLLFVLIEITFIFRLVWLASCELSNFLV